MQLEKVNIRFGETVFAVTKPFTAGQLREFQPAFMQHGGLFNRQDRFDAFITAVLAALSLEHPNVTREELLKIPVTPAELADASDDIALASGMFTKAQFDEIDRKKKEKAAREAAGETESGEVKASIGASSTVS